MIRGSRLINPLGSMEQPRARIGADLGAIEPRHERSIVLLDRTASKAAQPSVRASAATKTLPAWI